MRLGEMSQTGPMRIASLVTAAVLVLFGCGEQSTPDAAEASGQVAATGETATYDFTGTTLDGERFEGAALKGKPAVLWFWAPWCPTCRAQIPNVSRLAEQYDGEVAVVAVGGLDKENAIREMALDIPNATHLIDAKGEVWKHFRVTAQSTYTVIGADGKIKSEGYLDDADLNTLVEQLAG